MRWLIPLLSLFLLIPAFGQETTVPPARPTLDARLVHGVNGLGFRMYAELQQAKPGENIFLSPSSIELALAMTCNGAQGPTRDAMLKTLGVEGMSLEQLNAGNAQLLSLLRKPDPKVELSIANSLWGRRSIEFTPDFLKRVTTGYEAKLSTLNFTDPTAADTINAWVSESTRGKIPTLVNPAMLHDALMVLVNAIYFNGTWTNQFDKKLTRDGDFTLANGAKKTMPMMWQHGRFDYQENEAFQAISLPYGSRQVAMDVILPRRGMDLKDFRAQLTAENWAAWTKLYHPVEGNITMPRYKAKFEAGLKPALTALGMGIAFTENADFHGMLADQRLRAAITEAIHKSVLEVNEEGTVAAAVTGIIVATLSMPMEEFDMVVDHPFFLIIRDVPTGTILFMGMINNPE